MVEQRGSSELYRAAELGMGATFFVAVAANILAGRHPLHTVTLCLLILAFSAVRLHHVGRHGGLFAALRGAVVAQPVLHATTKALPASSGLDPGAFGHPAENSTTALHVLLAAAVVVAVAGADQS